ncbi:MAG TPA: carboxypeptidase regulatory-like domain-containing protein [Pyrinomonadaceae bacterium]|nr:carboxypeptidase regulatory-like domain-containing protein [Pyrinomonadaceae bacterium]
MAKLNMRLFSVFAMFLLGAMTTFSQSTVTGGINGKIVDPQGAIVSGAKVTITNLETNSVTTVTASEDGLYRVSNLQPGHYRVETVAPGFGKASTEVIVEVGTLTPANVALAIGEATAEVNVTAEAPVVNNNDPTSATNINQVSISELPINGRRAASFVMGTPGAAPDGGFGLISFRGISGLLNNSTVDGGDDNQAFFSEARGRTRISSSISQDAVREFQVNTSNYSAEFGRAAGGVVNTVTKSGTNEFHGSAFWFYRNNKYGARNPRIFPGGAIPEDGKPKDIRHQYGGSVGGPIVKDKLFFFFSFDQQKRDFPAVALTGSSTFLNPITVADPVTGGRTCGNTTLAGEILFCRGVNQTQTNAGLAYLTNRTGVVARRGDQTLILPKIDWVINDKHTFTAVYNRLRWDSPAGVQTAATVTNGKTSFGSDLVSLDSYNFRLNSVFSPTFLNEIRVQYSRDLEQQVADTPDPDELLSSDGTSPSAAIGGSSGITIGKPNFLNRNAYPDEKRWQFADTITLTRGIHTIKFGADINQVNDKLAALFTESGAYTYANIQNWITDFALASNPNTTVRNYSAFNQGFGPLEFKFRTRDFNFFYQQDVRLDSNVTVNFGLRYEYQQFPEPQLPNPAVPQTAEFPKDKDNFGPRIGFAWSFGSNSENVIRAGYGAFYGRITNSAISNAITNTGLAAGQRTFSPAVSAGPEYPNILAAPGASTFGGDIIYFSPSMQNPRIHQLDIVYERQIGKNTVLSFTGMSSYGQFLPIFIDTNLRQTGERTYTFSGGPEDGRSVTVPIFTGARPNTNFGGMTEIRSAVSSDYYGFVAQINRRFTSGLQFQTSYTYSSSKDNGQNSQTFTTRNSVMTPFDIAGEYSRSNFDVPHRFVASMVYSPETLFSLGGDSSAGRALLGGWTIAPIVSVSSGFTYTGVTTSSITGPQASGAGLLGAGGSSRVPGVERNAFRTPKIVNIDLRIARRFKFNESMNLEVLAEAFNLFNRTQFTGVNSTYYTLRANTTTVLDYSSTFGTLTAAGNSNVRERQIQFAARFHF